MKPLSLLVFVILTFTAATGALAGTLPLGLRAGFAAPIGDSRTGLGNGFYAGLSLVDLPDSQSGGGLDLTFHHFDERTSTLRVFGFPIDLTGRVNVFDAMLHVRVALAPKRATIFPYFKGGFGYEYVTSTLTLRTSLASRTESGSQSQAGIVAGTGVSIPTGKHTGLCIEGLYRHVQIESGGFDWITAGVTVWKDESH